MTSKLQKFQNPSGVCVWACRVVSLVTHIWLELVVDDMIDQFNKFLEKIKKKKEKGKKLSKAKETRKVETDRTI